jgi:thioesterase domain-containing protein
VREAKKGDDVGRYREACLYLKAVAPTDEEAQIDQEWERKKQEQNKKETLRLENELKGYKNNLIKESIRVRPTSSLISPCHVVCGRLFLWHQGRRGTRAGS